MHKINEISFGGHTIKSLGPSDILFNTDINWDTDVQSVHVSYFQLKEEKSFHNSNFINKEDKLIGVGFCNKTNKINVCFLDENSQIYFWVKPEEINFIGTYEEYWEKNDVRIHVKAIKEKWTTEKNTEKE
jgi:hypothetical protein